MNQRERQIISTAPSEKAKSAFRTILVAYDASEAAETALQHAIEFAQEFHSMVIVAYVESSSGYPEGEADSGIRQMADSKREIGTLLQPVSKRLDHAGIPNQVLQRVGSVSDILVQLAAEKEADLVLLGAYGQKGFQQNRLGSTAEFMLRSMPCPVITIGPMASPARGTIWAMQTMIYASSLPAKTGLATHVAEIIARRSAARVEILHVSDNYARPLDLRTRAELEREELALAKYLQDAGIEVTCRLTSGEQAHEILVLASNVHADLILFGIEHHPVPGTLGIISRTIQQAACPILTVPGPA